MNLTEKWLGQYIIRKKTRVDSPSRNNPRGVNVLDIPCSFWEGLEMVMLRHLGPIAWLVMEESYASFGKKKEEISIPELPSFLQEVVAKAEEYAGRELGEKVKVEVIALFNSTFTSI